MEATRENQRGRGRTFLLAFRWTIYTLFMGGMLFVAVCMVVGIVSHLNWRYSDLDIPLERPAALADIDQLKQRDCLAALERLHNDLEKNLLRALQGGLSRRELLKRWRRWSRSWRKQMEQTGFSCRLTEYSYSGHPDLGLLAGIYRLLDRLQQNTDRMVYTFVLENARPLAELGDLFARARRQLGETGAVAP